MDVTSINRCTSVLAKRRMENDEVIMLRVGNQWLTVLNEEIYETCTVGGWTRMIAAMSCGWMRLP